MRFTGVCLAAVVLLAGCADPRFVGRPGLTTVSNVELPAPMPRDQTAQQRAYTVGPYDVLQIDVFGVDELSKKLQVDSSGRLSMPLAGEVEAVGKTPTELARAIEDKLRVRYVRDPHVTVNVDTVNQSITVDGEVHEPGIYAVAGRVTLMSAVARAKGVTDFASQRHVVVFRQVDNKKMAALYDLAAIRQGIYDDPQIYPNDIVTVGESQSRRLFASVIQASPLLSAPVIALLN